MRSAILLALFLNTAVHSTEIIEVQKVVAQQQEWWKGFESERLVYRLAEMDDHAQLYQLLRRDEVRTTYYQEEASNWDIQDDLHVKIDRNSGYRGDTKAHAPRGFAWVVSLKESPASLVGYMVMLHVYKPESILRTPSGEENAKGLTCMNMSRAVNPEIQNKGYGTEMARTFIQQVFTHTCADVLISGSYVSNIASGNSAQKAGFIFKEFQGENDSELCLTIQRSEWEKTKAS